MGPLKRLTDGKICKDGYFHLITCKETNRIRLFCLLLAKMLHLTNDLSIILHHKIKSADFVMPESISLNLDGELANVTTACFTVLPQHLHVFAPR